MLMLHISKKSKFTALSERAKAKFAGKDDYYAKMVNEAFNWEKLSKDGELFDYTVLDAAFEDEKPILLK